MKSDVILVTRGDNSQEAALEQAEKVTAYKKLPPKASLHLRLLTEEMMSLVRTITGAPECEFWIEDTDGVYALHLKAETLTDTQQREQLISVSSDRKNSAAKGFVGKLRSFFEPAADVPMFLGTYLPGGSPHMYDSMVWSMESYRKELTQYEGQNREDVLEAWDELEKSVLAHVADNVSVSIRGRTVEMIVTKAFAA